MQSNNTARFFSSIRGEDIQCSLCPHRCILASGEEGKCRVRINHGGEPALPYYGYITGIALDPIEKKPLYHFRPGTDILSAGFSGCNLNCPFCQNWRISQSTNVSGHFHSPAELISAALKAAPALAAMHSIAYTYSEPLVHIEFLLDCMKEARKANVANVIVSNGCINTGAAEEILQFIDAANIDLKCFSEESYRDVLGGNLTAVTDFIRMAIEKGVHLEITTLVVPGFNDSIAELDKCRDFIRELQRGEDHVPWHLSAYHPNWKWNTPRTEPEFLNKIAARAREKLSFVYTGNIAGENYTLCLHCGKTLISRQGYHSNISGLLQKNEAGKPAYYCAACGKPAPVK